MTRTHTLFALVLSLSTAQAWAQNAKPSAPQSPAPPAGADASSSRAYSGMYSFQKEGEFVQVTVEDAGHVTGFISRYGDGDSDKGAFLNQFFKTGKLEGNNLAFTTDVVHGVTFDFKGVVERGDGKKPGDEAYFVLRGVLTENSSDANKKVTSHTRDVLLKKFPEDASPSEQPRK